MRLGDLLPAVTAILILGIALGVGVLVLSETSSQMANTEGSVTNESGAFINSTGYTLDKASETEFNSPEITAAYNVSNTSDVSVIPEGDYTLSEEGVLTNATATTYSDVNVSYTYEYGEDASSAVNETVSGLGDFATWISVIVVVIAAAIVLGIVMRSFGEERTM